MNQKLKEKIVESLSSVLPITLIVLVVGVILIPIDLGALVLFITGAVMLIFGMGFFQLGAEMALSPLGEGIGAALSRKKRLRSVLAIMFLMGVIITISEPDLQVLAGQVPAVPNRILIWTVAGGVGVFLAMAVFRIFLQIRLSDILIVLYAVVLIASFLVPRDFVAVAFDSGGVTTGPMTVPFIMATGIGLASVRGDKNAANDSFGLVALSSVGPVLAVMVLGCFFRPAGARLSGVTLAEVVTTRDVVRVFLQNLPRYMHEVMISFVPVLLVFLVFQLCSAQFKPRQVMRILIGFTYTYIGLVLFLCGVNVGFAPVGTFLGRALAGLEQRWVLVPIGVLIGYFIVKAEPAIQVLNRQVAAATDGAIPAQDMNRCLSAGVAISVGLAMLRVLTGLPLYWIVIPGYLSALLLSKLVPGMFVGIAFDSGGVASGPMTTTFLLPLSIGASEELGGSILTDAFGVVALVALTPLIAVQLMGFKYQMEEKRQLKTGIKQEAAAQDVYYFDGPETAQRDACCPDGQD